MVPGARERLGARSRLGAIEIIDLLLKRCSLLQTMSWWRGWADAESEPESEIRYHGGYIEMLASKKVSTISQ